MGNKLFLYWLLNLYEWEDAGNLFQYVFPNGNFELNLA